MTPNRRTRILTAAAVALLAAVLFRPPPSALFPVLDKAADQYFEHIITRAGVAYATCRAINAGVSVIQSSTLQLEPAGVGVSLAVGQALDPIDDMTERLSDVLVTAITSLGIQKLGYEISVYLFLQLLCFLLILWLTPLLIPHPVSTALRQITGRLILILIALRCCLPLSALAGQWLDERFFSDRMAAAHQQLSQGPGADHMPEHFVLPESDGLFGTIENSARFIKERSAALKDTLSTLLEQAGEITQNLLTLTFMYTTVFLTQVIVLPVLFFWLLMKLTQGLMVYHRHDLMPSILSE